MGRARAPVNARGIQTDHIGIVFETNYWRAKFSSIMATQTAAWARLSLLLVTGIGGGLVAKTERVPAEVPNRSPTITHLTYIKMMALMSKRNVPACRYRPRSAQEADIIVAAAPL
jgi:hypothetical protein